jgi:peptide/nickel transport system substrate-binding protein
VTDQPTPRPTSGDPLFDHPLSRGTLLRGAAGAALGMSPLLAAACGGSSGSTAPATTTGGKPKSGGTLRVGFVGGGTAETLDPLIAVTPIDQGRVQNLYDPLVLVNPDFSTSPGLALSWTHNSDATMWEVKLRPDVTFHNGKTFGADDLMYSINAMAAPTSYAVPFVSEINVKDMKKVNNLTVQIPLKTADASLPANFTYYNTWIIQDGEKDFKHPVGTGPFMADTFTPGQQSVFKKNPNYWMNGKPYVDELKIISITDPTARLNALLAGDIDAMAQLPTALAKAHQSTGDIVVFTAKSPQPMMFYMDTTKAPFNDNNVRLAMKLIADRPALVAGALNGFGAVANDIVGKGLPLYNDSLPQRVQDIEKAKSLLKAAGHQNLSVLLQTSQIFPGFVESATLLAQQAKAAGVTINLKQEPANSYYNPSLLYLKMPFAETQWAITSLKFFYLQALASNAPYNETHWHSPSFNDLLLKAIAETDQAKAQGYWNQVQAIQYNEGGYLNWVNADWVDGLSNKVKGMVPSGAGALGNMTFLNAWLA